MPIAGSDEQGVVLRLTAGEVEALEAVTRGVGAWLAVPWIERPP